MRDAFWLQGMAPATERLRVHRSLLGHRLPADLAAIDVPTLVIHGDDDQVVPFEVGGKRPAELVKDATWWSTRRARTASPTPTATHSRMTSSSSSTPDRHRRPRIAPRQGDAHVTAEPRHHRPDPRLLGDPPLAGSTGRPTTRPRVSRSTRPATPASRSRSRPCATTRRYRRPHHRSDRRLTSRPSSTRLRPRRS